MTLAADTTRRLAELLLSQGAANDFETQANAIAGTYVTPASVSIAGGITSSSPTGGLGYGTGAGGTVTQATSKNTSVTINNFCGQITMNAAALTSGSRVTFTVLQTGLVTTTASDLVAVCIASGATAGAYALAVTAVGASSFAIELTNNSAGSLSEALVLNFIRLRGRTS